MALFQTRARVKALEAEVAELKRRINVTDDLLTEVGREAFDGALAEVREVRDRINPFFGNGAEANAEIIAKVAKLPKP